MGARGAHVDRAEQLLKGKPFFVGDEAAVLRFTRPVRRRRRMVQAGFLVGIAGLGGGFTVLQAAEVWVVGLGFGGLSSGFILTHLAVGKRKWMRPVEAFEDGVEASEVTRFFCRRRFLPWKRVESIKLAPAAGGGARLVVGFAPSRSLESAPGEVDAAALAALEKRWAQVKAEAEAARAVFDAVGRESPRDG